MEQWWLGFNQGVTGAGDLLPRGLTRRELVRSNDGRIFLQSDQLTIRQALRRATDDLHTGLDAALGGLDLADREQYAAFLSVQLSARRPIEQWLAVNAAADICPPAQSDLLVSDLAALRIARSTLKPTEFAAPTEGVLGVAWAIGGSSMGNRMMLRALRQSSGNLPTSFLADERMASFFAGIRPAIEGPAETYAELVPAISAARAVFTQFSASFAAHVTEWEQAA